MKGKTLIAVAITSALFSGCALPELPSAFPKVPEVQKWELDKYKTMDFDEFMSSLPIVYTTDRIREISIDCKNIKPEHPMMCHPLNNPMLGDFFKGLKREAERYCLSKGGFIRDRKEEMIIKYTEKRELDKVKKLKAASGWDGYSCKIDGVDYFGYVGSGTYLQFYTPKWFQSVFDVFTAEPYLKLAKDKGLSIKEYPKYFEISGENAKELLKYEIYIEEGRTVWVDKFTTAFSKDVLFSYAYLIRDKEISKKVQELSKKAEAVITNRVYEDYPVFRNLDAIDSLDIKLEGSLWAKIPLKATTKDGKVLIFKQKEFKATYIKILQDATPFLEDYFKLVNENTSTYISGQEMFNY